MPEHDVMMMLAPAHASGPSSFSCSCNNADVFRKINALLGNNLNLSGVCRCSAGQVGGGARDKPPRSPPRASLPQRRPAAARAAPRDAAAETGPRRRHDAQEEEAEVNAHGIGSSRCKGGDAAVREVSAVEASAGPTVQPPSDRRSAARGGEPGDKVSAGKVSAGKVVPRLEVEAPAPPSCHIEKAALLQRKNAVVSEAKCTWSGKLPKRNHQSPTYACKVFMGGVPWDITEAGIVNSMKNFGPLVVEWPIRDGKQLNARKEVLPKGYLYVLFEHERSVRALLQACKINYNTAFGCNMYFYEMSSRKMKTKMVQVIPWVVSDSNYTCYPSLRLETHKTVFVGALHGMLNAEGLASIMNDLFGGVVYAGIDTDKYKYPIGSGRVTFNNSTSYFKAVTAAIVEIKTTKFTKKIQIDPYLEDSVCHLCNKGPGNFFCRATVCFSYYCRDCWELRHAGELLSTHRPLMKNQRGKVAP